VLINAVDAEGSSDHHMYREAFGDARLAQALASTTFLTITPRPIL
jgi:hypothetical protein